MIQPHDSTDRALVAVAGVGLCMFGTTLATVPERFWANWLVWFVFFLSIGLGSLFLVAIEHLVGARWSVPVRRVPERLAGLVVAIVPVAVLALFSLPVLYPWAGPDGARLPLVVAKSGWLNVPFFTARLLACLALWAVSHRILVGGSIAQDQTRDPGATVRSRRFAPVFMVIFAFSVTVVAFDWISGLAPEWYSDIFGVYLFAGVFLAGLAATTIGVSWLSGKGRLPGVKPDHLYSLGCFMFGFTVFWSYIAFAQYLLIWYANMPEEVFWYKHRIEGGWQWVTLALAVVHFVIPFFVLAPRGSKTDLTRLRRVAVVVLAGHLLDLYWLVLPSVAKVPPLSWPELGGALFFLGLGGLWVRRSMAHGEDMPVGDPFLAEGLEFKL